MSKTAKKELTHTDPDIAFSSADIAAYLALAESRSAFSFAWSTGVAGDLSSAIAVAEANANAPAKRAAISFLFIDLSSEKCICVREVLRASTIASIVRPLFSVAIWVDKSKTGSNVARLRNKEPVHEHLVLSRRDAAKHFIFPRRID